MVSIVVSRLSQGMHIIGLEGRLGLGWAGTFARGLSDRDFNIENAHAGCDARGHWAATFEVTAGPRATEPSSIDLATLASEPARYRGPARFALASYALTRSADGDEALLVVDAPDQSGFLAQLLDLLALFSLFPSEMEIRTVAGRVHDRLTLRSTGGATPSERALAAVRAALDGTLGTLAAPSGRPSGASIA